MSDPQVAMKYGNTTRYDLEPAILRNYRQSEARLQTIKQVVDPILTFWNGLPLEVRFRPSVNVLIPNQHLIDLADTWRLAASAVLDLPAEMLRPGWVHNSRSVADLVASGEWVQ